MSDQSKPLLRKSALITGASRGIGEALAHSLADAGAHVVIGARSEDQLQKVADAINAAGGKATPIVFDVSKKEECETFIEKARDASGNPDILINNAGIGVFRPIDKFQEDEFEQQFRTNVFGPFYLTSACVPLMKENGGGHIVNVSSLASKNAAKMGSGYFATKWALNGFSKCVFEDVREHNIKVTTVCPGSVDSRFHIDSHPGSHPKDQSWMVTPDQVADTILHLLLQPDNCTVSELDIRPTYKPKK